MARIYRRDDSGGPAITYVTSGSGAPLANFNALRDVLIGCLVTGYPGKPPAGWELLASGENYLVLRNGIGSGCLGLTLRASPSPAVIEVWVAEHFSAVVDGRITGSGARSGNGGVIQRLPASGYLAYSSGGGSWAVVADEKTFVITLTGHFDNEVISGNWTYDDRFLSLYCGEESEGGFICIGGVDGRGQNSFSGYAATVLKDPATGFLLGASATVQFVTPTLSLGNTYSSGSYGNYSNAPLPLGRVSLVPATWFSGAHGGRLRGVCQVPELLSHSVSGAGLSLGFTSPPGTRTFAQPLPLGDSFGYALGVRRGESSIGAFLLTDNPEFW